MFGIKKHGQQGKKSGRRQEPDVWTLPVGKTGASRVEEELLCPGRDDNEIESWRIFKIMAEFVDGFELLRKYGLAATIFGSSRADFDPALYEAATELGRQLAGEGFAVITGGGNGVMGAANQGAKEAGGDSVGLNIGLPEEQQANAHTTDRKEFHYFFTRKVMLSFSSEVYVFFPGGFGTLDELFEMLTLVQTKKVKRVPIILFGREHWEPLVSWLHSLAGTAFDTAALEILDVVDSVDEAMAIVKKKVCR